MNPENAYKEFDGNLLELEIFQNHFPILGKYASNIPNQFFFGKKNAKNCIMEANCQLTILSLLSNS